MAFTDSPNVDDKSKLSEESVHFVKGIFTRKNGFIAREEIPDYGVDIDVELIYSGGNASSHKFPTQIKSEKELSFISVKGVQYVSISFKTSRLGYLCRRVPVYGLVIAYDETTQTAYYDYVEEIVNRITNERGNEEWKDQSEVNIHIPLNALSAQFNLIYKKFSNRYADLNDMLRRYGPVFNIPVLNYHTPPTTWNFGEEFKAVHFLNDYGRYLFNIHEYSRIIALLQTLPAGTINRSKELIFLAMITYGQAGLVIEADYYLKKAAGFDYDQSEREMIKLIELRTVFLKGDLDSKSLEKEYQKLIASISNKLNRLNVEVSLLHLRIISSIREEGKVDDEVLVLTEELNSRIWGSSIHDNQKNILLLFNSENLFNYWAHVASKDATKLNLQLKFGKNISVVERAARASRFIQLISIPQKTVFEIFKNSGEDKIVTAYASYFIARFFFNLRFNSMLIGFFNEDPLIEEPPTEDYHFHLKFAYSAVAHFIELSMLKEAHQALTCAYELQKMFSLLYNNAVGLKSTDALLKDIRRIEGEAGISPFNSLVQEAYNDLMTSRAGAPRSMAEAIPDDAEISAAQAFVQAQDLPIECVEHVVYDIRVHKIFERECPDKNIELLQWWPRGQGEHERYLQRPVYVLRSRVSGIESKKSSDIFELLDQFKGIINKKV